MSESIVLYETDVLGIAYTSVRPGYLGHCSLTCSGRTKQRAVFPTTEEAHSAARFAVGELGGFNVANVHEAPDESVTHASWEDWAL